MDRYELLALDKEALVGLIVRLYGWVPELEARVGRSAVCSRIELTHTRGADLCQATGGCCLVADDCRRAPRAASGD